MGRTFTKDPVITFTKVSCPFCRKPTGSDTNCESMQNSISDSLLFDPNGVPLNVFSKSCIFKQNRRYYLDINYIASDILLERLNKVAGINTVAATQPYKILVEISTAFDESETKANLARTYKAYVKEMEAAELHLEDLSPQPATPKSVKVTMPNGQSSTIVLDSPTQHAMLQELKDTFPNAQFEEL